MSDKTVLTGVQASGNPHIGNLKGAILPSIALVNNASEDSYIFIADVHALNGVKDKDFLRDKTYEVAATYLAFGLDTEKAVFYRQSDIPEIFELTSILMNFTPKGLMNRAHAYKAKFELDGNDENVNMGLYTYPILMSADIIIMAGGIVPVGPDQKQHIEIARDIANSFNSVYKEDILQLPTESLAMSECIIGLDGRKMSKSYNNTVELFASEEDTVKKVMKIPTDSLTPDEPKSADCLLYKLMSMFNVDEEYKADFLSGGIGYGDAKKVLASKINETLAPAREKYASLIADKPAIDRVLQAGATRARKKAIETLTAVKKTLGLLG